jgi:hypothetical protein
MYFSRIKHDRFTRFALGSGLFLALPFLFGAAQEQKSYVQQEFVRFACQNVTVNVDPKFGTDPKAVYLCAGNTLTWVANSHKFIVIFRKNSPFINNQKVFDNNNYQSKPAKNDVVLTVYNYDIIVDGEPIEDPQVVGGGGHGP